MTKVALFLPRLDGGGAERVMLDLARSFAGRGHEVHLVVATPGGDLEGQTPAAVRVVALRAARSMAALPALVRYLRAERPAALLATLEHANILAVLAASVARTGTRVVLREANVLLPREHMHGLKPHAERALMRACYRGASTVIAVSKSVENDVVAGLGLRPGHVRTIYNPVLTPDLDDKAHRPVDDPWFADGAPPVILAVGRLTVSKDHATLVRAFATVRAKRPARLLILGEGGERAALEKLAGDLGVVEDVRLPGFDPNPFRFMSRAAVFVLSSLYEGLPGGLIQAMACGCRVISTDCPGGSREILQADSPRPLGPLVPMRDPARLAEAILAQLDDADHGPARVTHPVDRFAEASAVDAYLDALGLPRSAT